MPLLDTALLILVAHPSCERRKPSVCLGLGSVKATVASHLFFLRLLSQLSRCSTVHYHCFEIQNLLLISKERKILKVPMKRNFSYVNIQLIICANQFRQRKISKTLIFTSSGSILAVFGCYCDISSSTKTYFQQGTLFVLMDNRSQAFRKFQRHSRKMFRGQPEISGPVYMEVGEPKQVR